MVAASQPLAVQAGLDALRDGGNAVDAALAAAITLTVVEPANNGVGGDAFAQVWDGQQLVGLNASGRAPEGWNPARFAGRKTMPRLGWDSVTVPGAISAWVALSDRFGHLPFTRLFDAAIHYARVGFQVGPKTAEIWSRAQARYADFPDFAEHFLPAPKAGRRVCRPALARTLQELADSHGSSFYTGAIAARIERAAIAAGGAMRRTDLANHRAEWVTPLRQPYRKALVHELPPNGQGIAALVALGILQHRELEPLDSANGVHLVLEATRIAIRAAFEHVAEPQSLAVAAEALLDPTLLARLAEGITDRAAPRPPAILPTNQDTVCLAAADSSGMMVSFIQSNYEGFGSGIVIPDSGIAMHNRGAGFSLTPGHPNQVGPGKRPFHTIIPGFVTESGKPRLAFGLMGGHMQHQGHVQMVQRILGHGQDPQAASDAPRWHITPDDRVLLEPGFDASIVADLARRGHRVALHQNLATFGGAQLILRTEDGYIGGSDHRKEGQAAGF